MKTGCIGLLLLSCALCAEVPPGLKADGDTGRATGKDNGPAIQEAIDRGANPVEMPAGTFAFGKLKIPPGTRFMGLGQGVTVLVHTGDGTAIEVFGNTAEEMYCPPRIEHMTIFGTSRTKCFIQISEIYQADVNHVTLWNGPNAYGVEMLNRTTWTEGTELNRVQFRGVLRAFKSTVADHNIKGTRSFAQTKIRDCTVVLTDAGRVFDIGPWSYFCGFEFGCKVNIDRQGVTLPLAAKAAIVEMGEASAAIDGNWDIYQELQGDQVPFNRFVMGWNSQASGTGRVFVMPSPTMSSSNFAADSYDTRKPGGFLYVKANGEMLNELPLAPVAPHSISLKITP